MYLSIFPQIHQKRRTTLAYVQARPYKKHQSPETNYLKNLLILAHSGNLLKSTVFTRSTYLRILSKTPLDIRQLTLPFIRIKSSLFTGGLTKIKMSQFDFEP